MNLKNLYRKIWLLVLALVLVACATTGGSAFHSFTFDALRDSKDVEVLQYRYGDDGGFNTRSTQTEIQTSKVTLGTHVAGTMVVGKDLYVKWRIKSTGQVVEDSVDLKSRLPFSIANHELRFIIEGTQLYVYLISHQPVRPYFSKDEYAKSVAFANTPRAKSLASWGLHRVTMIYPEKRIDPHIPAELRK
ncbi:MAG: hypothetical protein KBF98_09760 [Rhodoferax sp.]|nr:hypothetical protein [Aquabacterium sp.]MBP9060584.1 hypothetical protein [Rhodoferax sp.]